MATSSDIKKVIINILACNKTRLSKKNKEALLQLLDELEDNDLKKNSKKITEREWYKILKDIATILGQIAFSFTNFNYEPR